MLFVALTTEDVVTGQKPHDIFNYRDPLSVIGISLILSGLALRSWAVGVLRKDAELTTTGSYSSLRTPADWDRS